MRKTCPPKWAEGKRKPLQEEEHRTGQASEEVREVGRGSAGWAATGSGAVEKGEHMNPGSEGSSASRLSDMDEKDPGPRRQRANGCRHQGT